MTLPHTGLLVIGAGPTGLGAAWRLVARGETDWRLADAAPGAGGLAGSVTDEHGFTWDLGGHVQFSHYDYFDDLMDDLLGPDGWLSHQRESWVWLRQRFVPYPFQLNLHRLPEREQRQCVRGLITAAVAASQDAPRPDSFGRWIDAAFGPGIGDVFLRPYNWKVWAHGLDRLSWSWIGDRVALVDLPRVVENIRLDRDDVSWGPNNQFRFPRHGGTGAIWRALAARLDQAAPGHLQFGRRVASVNTAAHVVTFADGRQVHYDRLLSTMPLDALVAASDLAPALTPAARRLMFSSTHVIGIGLHGHAPAHLAGKCWMYFPEDDCPFYRATHFSHYSPNNVADITRQWSLMAEVAESSVKPVDAARVVGETIDGLLNTGLIPDRAAVHHTWHRRLPRGYPTPSLGRDAALEELLPSFEARDVFSRGRFGAWKYEVSNQDHSFAQGVECVDRLRTGAVETTLHQPEIVNARRSTPRAAAWGRR
ncbi:MAG: FAD-dependent oxidoreductase [Acidobacteria bacterium]|nr:FAD-dependent oxidoreductase [Acidobacteriota bacterium]